MSKFYETITEIHIDSENQEETPIKIDPETFCIFCESLEFESNIIGFSDNDSNIFLKENYENFVIFLKNKYNDSFQEARVLIRFDYGDNNYKDEARNCIFNKDKVSHFYRMNEEISVICFVGGIKFEMPLSYDKLNKLINEN